MTTIKLNNTEFEVESYNKNTYFTGENIMSNANCSIKVVDMNTLNALVPVAITSIQIKYDNNIIYNLTDVNAKIDSINEYLNGDHMNTNVNFTFISNGSNA